MGNRLVLVGSGQTPEEKRAVNQGLYLKVCVVAVVTHLAGGCQARAPAGAHGPWFSPSGGKESRVPRPTYCSAA